jgi:protocatechuate 3,4-dioxygenase beta subunit
MFVNHIIPKLQQSVSKYGLTMVFILNMTACSNGQQQTKPDWRNLYDCEGCEGVLEGPEKLTSQVEIPGTDEPGKKMNLSGTVYLADGKTPAENVILYFYHTNNKGIYPTRGNETGWGKRQGYLRGWIKTGADGRYLVKTIRPGTYPSRSDPAHVHMMLKEPGRKPYWVDDYVFEDDPLVDAAYRNNRRNRGGNGIITLKKENGVWEGKRDIVLAPQE